MHLIVSLPSKSIMRETLAMARMRSGRAKNIDEGSEQFIFQGLIKEYEMLRREIELRLQLQEKLFNYFFLLVAGSVSAYAAFPEVFINIGSFLAGSPALYLLLAIFSMVFPLVYTDNNIMIATIGSYERDVLSIKLNKLMHYKGLQPEYMQWETNRFPKAIRGLLRWNDYRARVQYRQPRVLFFVLSLFTNTFNLVPPIFFLVSFLLVRGIREFNMWEVSEQLLFVGFLVLATTFVLINLFAIRIYRGFAVTPAARAILKYHD